MRNGEKLKMSNNEKALSATGATAAATYGPIAPPFTKDALKPKVSSRANPVSPSEHTMEEQHFLEYIGRYQHHGVDKSISGKKFTDEQKKAIAAAYEQALPVRVFGLPARHFKNHLEHLPTELGFVTIEEEFPHATKSKKLSNRRRSDFFRVKVLNPTTSNTDAAIEQPTQLEELWVMTFPSPEYVEQIAQLIQAIFDDFDRKREKHHTRSGDAKKPSGNYPHLVEIIQFPQISRTVSKWTGLSDGLLAFVRHGDVVVIGNVDRMLAGLQTMRFEEKFASWQQFGDDNMFSVQVLVHAVSHSRIVLLGIEECFWGSASARYVESALQAGARHILYCSKAGGLDAFDQLHELRTPQHFAIFSPDFRQRSEGLGSAAVLDAAVFRLATQFDVLASGTNITVPTVIGETQEQRERLKESGLTTVDNEDGHIARVIASFNRDHRFDPAVFFPVHFITDYLRKPNEHARRDQPHLASEDDAVSRKRDVAFEKIGTLFGTYAALYGLREFSLSIVGKTPKYTLKRSDSSHELLASVSEFVDAGLMREAGNALCGDRPLGEQDPATLVSMGLLCQKHGYVDEAFHICSLLESGNVLQRLIIEDRFRAKLTEIKIASQVGQYSMVRDRWAKLCTDFNHLSAEEKVKVHPQMRSGVHRFLLACQAIDPCVDRAHILENHKEFFVAGPDTLPKDTLHADTTTKFFHLIASIRDTDQDFESVLSGLADVRREMYECHENHRPIWRADANRSAVTSLFVEAAVLLLGNSLQQARGRARLVAAHVLNARVMGRERSEGLGDLLSYVPDVQTQSLLRRAMRVDGIGRQSFQQTPGIHELLLHTQPVLKVLSLPVGERARSIVDLLTTLDKRTSAKQDDTTPDAA